MSGDRQWVGMLVWLPVCLLMTAMLPCSYAARLVISHGSEGQESVRHTILQQGHRLVSSNANFTVVETSTSAGPSLAKESSFVSTAENCLSSISGVTAVENDYIVDYGDRAQATTLTLDGVVDEPSSTKGTAKLCTDLDIKLGKGPLAEIQPYGVRQIQADSSKLLKAAGSTKNKGVVVCVVDSGLDASHPDLKLDDLNGCKLNGADTGGCPFPWNNDYVSHGTHVSGIVGAPRNGFGVVGAVPGGAEVYMVKVFNSSGDVNQGQGLVYGSSLLIAYTQCEGHLNWLQATKPKLNYRMVMSMSLGAPGPLTVERVFFR